MLKISKKCQYALKAVFELAWRRPGEPIKTHDVADAQGVSPRFMEIILNELKHGGFVESKRGNEGGYMLARDPMVLTVREVVEYVQGPISVAPEAAAHPDGAALFGNEAFRQLWQDVNSAVLEVCGNRSFADLVEFEQTRREQRVPNYCI